MKPFISLQTTQPFDQVLYQVLDFHLPEGATILDPTPGEKHSWRHYLKQTKKTGFFPLKKFNILFVEDDISNFQQSAKALTKPVDAVFFDPPYIFGKKKSKDARREDYGGYGYSFEDIYKLMYSANENIRKLLKSKGLLFLKYTDVFSLEERRFYFCAHEWPLVLDRFEVIDHYIVQHHHVSPTAWQVKDRPCGIVNYTYLTVFRIR